MKENEVGKACRKHGKIINVYIILVGKPERKELLRTQSTGFNSNLLKCVTVYLCTWLSKFGKSTLNMEAAGFSKMLPTTFMTTCKRSPGNRSLYVHL